MLRPSRRTVCALAAWFLVASFPGTAPAAIDQASAHFIAPGWSFQQCRARVQRALQAERLAMIEDGANSGDFRASSLVRRDADGALETAVVTCWPTPGGVRITFACASQTPDNRVKDLCKRLIAHVFGPQRDPALTGFWVYRDGSFRDVQVLVADGTAHSRDRPGATATWSVNNGLLEVRWADRWINRYTLPADANGRLSGAALGPAGQRHRVTLARQ